MILTATQKRYLGKWELSDGSSSVIYEILEGKRGIKVVAVDKDDGEKLVVSQVRWRGPSLEFRTFVRSNGFRASHRLTMINRGRIRQELTTIESWRRLS